MRKRIKRDDDKDHKDSSNEDSRAALQDVEPSPKSSNVIGCLKKSVSGLKYVLLVLIVPGLLNYAALLRESAALLPQGAFYDVGFGQKIFMMCNGTGSPTVILDAPTGMSSDVWTFIYQDISKVTKVCMYDRAGLGFSDRPKEAPADNPEDDQQQRSRWQPYTVERMVDDLHRLVTYSSQQPRPLILVGAEISALVARFYAQVYEGDVAAVVLIEPLPEDLFLYEKGSWQQFWSGHLVSRYQAMQLSAAVGLTRLALMIGSVEYPMIDVADKLPVEVVNRQKHLLCNPRHLSSVVDEHFFINETFSQMQTVFRIKGFPQNVSVTIINGNRHDNLLSAELNNAWSKAQQNLVSMNHPNSKRITHSSADRKILYQHPHFVSEPVKQLIQQWRRRPQSS